MIDRREMLRAGAAAPLGLLALVRSDADAKAASPNPPRYTISINIEIVFNTGRGNPPMPRAEVVRKMAEEN